MRLHCIGDSHCCFFLGENRISKEYPVEERGIFSNIYCYRLGSPLAFNLSKNKSSIQSREKIFEIVSKLNPREDYLLLSFGEVDCRAHLLKQQQKTGESDNEVVSKCIDNYLLFVKELLDLGFTVFLWGAVYSASYDDSYDFEYPYFGDSARRNNITKIFNSKLKANQNLGYYFLDVTSFLLETGTLTTNNVFYFDEIHLNNKLFLRSLSIIKKIRPEITFKLRLIKSIEFIKCLIKSK